MAQMVNYDNGIFSVNPNADEEEFTEVLSELDPDKVEFVCRLTGWGEYARCYKLTKAERHDTIEMYYFLDEEEAAWMDKHEHEYEDSADSTATAPAPILSIQFRGYAGIQSTFTGTPEECGRRLAEEMRSKMKGRMTDEAVGYYTKLFATGLQMHAEDSKSEWHTFKAYGELFPVGTAAGTYDSAEIPVLIYDVN